MTYAAGLNAVTIVWIAERFTEEHRAALDWLNERTDEKINLFGLEIELWRIGDSPIAPKFNIISQPNDWSRTVQQAAATGGQLSKHKQLQLKFWTAFKEYMEAKGSFVRCREAGAPTLDDPFHRQVRSSSQFDHFDGELRNTRHRARNPRGTLSEWVRRKARVRNIRKAEGVN